MTPLDPFWAAYSALQQAASASSNISASLALEGALTLLLDRADSSQGLSPSELDSRIARSINTFACRDKSRARARIRHHGEIERDVAHEGSLAATVLVNEIRALISTDDWNAILSIAMGWSYRDIAGPGVSPAALRVRVSRARDHLRQAA